MAKATKKRAKTAKTAAATKKTTKKATKKTTKRTKAAAPAKKVAVFKNDGRAAELSGPFIKRLDGEFYDKPLNRFRQNAAAEGDIDKLNLNQELALTIDRNCSIQLDSWGPTDQGGSGRCWLFSALNLFRVGAMKKLKLKNFEFSQNWAMFWDKFEKANYFLEAIIDCADLPPNDRTMGSLYGGCVSDGGQWNMFVNVMRKYGIVPKAAMPETKSSMGTGSMNGALTTKLRLASKVLRDMVAAGATMTDLRNYKASVLEFCYDVLRIHLGNPPTKFDWTWKDDKGKLRREAGMTPKGFMEKYFTLPIEDYVCLVHDPRPTSPYGRTFTVKYLGNVVEGGIVKYLNVDIELMKKITLQTLKDGEPVWFGCDCGKQMHRDKSVWDDTMYTQGTFYDQDFSMPDKADRLMYGMTAMNHAMLFTGVDVVKGKPRAWRVENSWSNKGDGGGFYLMHDNWFNEHMFEIAARKKYLPAKLQKALELEPIVLPPWDPMGSLAR